MGEFKKSAPPARATLSRRAHDVRSLKKMLKNGHAMSSQARRLTLTLNRP
jgi:hypothetical protein